MNTSSRLLGIAIFSFLALAQSPSLAAELWTYQFVPDGSLPYSQSCGECELPNFGTRADVAGTFTLLLDWERLTGQLLELNDQLVNIHDVIWSPSGSELRPTQNDWINPQIVHSSGSETFLEGPFTFENGMWKVTSDGRLPLPGGGSAYGLPYTITFDLQQSSFNLTVGADDAYVDVINAPATFVNAIIAGDFDGNFIVDTADYVVWRKTGGSPTGYQFWQQNFGYGTSGGGSNTMVPEPVTMVYLVTVLWLTSLRRVSGEKARERASVDRGRSITPA